MTASFIPNPVLPIGRTFTVSLSTSIKDTTGNNLAATGSYSFSTGFAEETTPPHFVASSPLSGASGIPVNALIDLQFSEPLDIASVVPNIQVMANGQPVPVLMALSSGDERITITPASGLQPNETYTVTIGGGISDLAGLVLDNPGSFSFQTAALVDQTQLTVVTVSPSSGSDGVPLNALMQVGFNKAVDVVSLGNGDLVLYPQSVGGGFPVADSLTSSSNGQSVTFTPGAALDAETNYCLYVSGVVDLEGNPLAQNGQNLSCFTTGASAQTAGPTVVSVSPVNATVEVLLSEPVSAVSVGPGAIALTAGGQPVAGTVSVTSPTTLAFTPSNSLSVSATYTVKVGGFTDVAGNAATAFTSGFTTSSSPTAETGPLQVTGITPASGSTGVVVAFNEAVNPLTVNNQSVNVQASYNGGTATVAGSYAVSGSTVTFTPQTPLPGSATVYVYVDYYAAVQDLAGNSGQFPGTTSFTTASTQDTTAPKVLSVVPGNGATGIGLNGEVTITFSKSMNPSSLGTYSGNSSISLLVGGAPQSFNLRVSADNTTVVLYGLNLPASTVITVSVPHTVTDLSGKSLASDFASQFTTGPGFDTTHASVVNQRPGNGATGVGVNASPLVLFWNEALNASTVSGAVHISQNGHLVPGTVTVSDSGQTVEFTPSSPWQYGALVQVFVDATAEDAGGNAVTPYQASFTTAGDPATTAPAVINYSPASGATNVPLNALRSIGYSEPLLASTVNTSDVFLNGPGGTVASTVALDTTGTVVTLTPSAALTAGSQYCFYAYGSNDLTNGLQGVNGQSSQSLGYCFTTGGTKQTTGPAITAVSPANKLVNVPVNANISLLFSAPVDPLTVNGTTVQVTGGGQTAMPASIGFTNNNQTVQITPESPLPVSTAMTVTVKGVTDAAGNAVSPFTSTFTTGAAPDTVTLVIVNATPPANATGVPVNAVISLEASTAIDGTTVNPSSFYLYDTVLGQSVAGSYSLSSDATTMYLLPSAPLATGRTYSVYMPTTTPASPTWRGTSCRHTPSRSPPASLPQRRLRR